MKLKILLCALMIIGTPVFAGVASVQDAPGGGYQMTDDDGKTWSVPADPKNRHYRRVRDWIARGNTPMAMPAPPPPSAREKRMMEYGKHGSFRDLVEVLWDAVAEIAVANLQLRLTQFRALEALKQQIDAQNP